MNKDTCISVGILGATGYTGRELVRLLSVHPRVRIDYLGTSSVQGQKYDSVYPELCGWPVGDVTMEDEREVPQVDILFCALPHGIVAARAPELLERGIRIIDLGADFRLKDPACYQAWYDLVHPHEGYLSQAVYGLTEIYREKIASASLVANPGCYPTASLIPLTAFLKKGLIKQNAIIIDAKSGVSGAGRGASRQNHFCEIDGSFKAYGLEGHRHKPEIEQELSAAARSPVHITFTPHLVPMTRGMMATIYVKLHNGVREEDLRRCWQEAYKDDAFVRVLPPGVWPASKYAWGNNCIYMQVAVDLRSQTAVVVSVLDNLMKGASGQAVQNMNVLCGLPETQGLASVGLWP